MVRALALSSILILTLAACQRAEAPASGDGSTATAPAPASSGETLTPEGLGPLRIGMTVPQLAQVWGGLRTQPEDVMSCAILEFADSPPGVQIMLNGGEVRHIILNRFATLKTEKGFGPGDDGAAVKAAYGDAAAVSPAKYDPPPAEEIIVWSNGDTSGNYVWDLAARGVRYIVGGDGKVSTVMAGGPTIQLVEGCG
ncbi:MAG: hypothetical protein K2X07_02925 [Caulobacteraceae bacterium]|nr:hypothetical protein [Caulobacteraceae bacterium]